MNTPFTSLALMVAIGLPGAAAATQTTPPKPGPARQVTTPKVVATTLDNGLRVLVAQRADEPLVTAELVVLSGSEVDPAKLPGAAEMTATLLTRGTASRSAPQIAADAAALGGAIRASAGWDETDIGITVTTPKLDEALALLADVTLHPTFAKAELERARREALDSLRIAWGSPGALSRMVARRAVFGGGDYGHPGDGTPDSLKALGRDDLLRLHSAWYRPDNAVLIFAGDIAPKDAFALASKAFGEWRKPEAALPQAQADTGTPVAAKVVAVDLDHAGQAGVVVAGKAIPRDADDYYAGLVANAVLGGSYSARLNEEVRIKRGLSYGAGSHLAALRHGGWVVATAQTKNPSAAQVVDLMLKQVASLAGNPPDAGELKARKATLVGGFGRSLETTRGLASQVAERAVYGIDPNTMGEFISRVEAVDSKQVQAFANKHLGADGMRVVVVGDASVYGKALDKAWPKAQHIQSTALDLERADLGLKLDETKPVSAPKPAG
ncbi:MAG TPA: pitrilysin family protein [Rhodanobacteraceae bacterium]|nr:pitrilysin family protein [Rhodanobacteraceae bacterium]